MAHLRGIPTRRPGRRPTGLPADRRSVSGAIGGRRSAVSRRATGFCAYPHEPVYRRSDADRRAIGIRSAVNRFDCVCACFAETQSTKMDDDMMFFQFAALIVANELMFGEGSQEYKRVHRYWVRPWIGRRDNSDTAFTLMRELQAVSSNLVKKERFWPVQSAASIGSEKSNAFDSCSCPSIGADRQSAGSRCRLSRPSPVWRAIPTSRRLVRSAATYDRPATQSPKLPPIVPPIVPKSPSGYGPLVVPNLQQRKSPNHLGGPISQLVAIAGVLS